MLAAIPQITSATFPVNIDRKLRRPTYQGKRSGVTSPGSGLGLAISKRIVEMHGGTIDVQSVLGEGSTFRIVIPVRAEKQMEAA